MRKRAFIVLAVVILAPFALLGTLLYTSVGVSLIASQLGRLEGFGVHIEGLSGELNGPLHIRRFELDNPNVHIVSNDLMLELRIRELLFQTIRVESFTARDTVVAIRNAPPTPPSTKPLRFVPSFLRIDVRNADFASLRYVNIDGTAIDATHLRGRVRVSPQSLRIQEFEVEAPQFRLAGNGRLSAQRPMGLELRVNGDLRFENGTEVAASGQTSGTIERLSIQATVLRPDVVNVDALFTRPDNHWLITGHVAAPAISLQPWMEKPPFSFRNVALKVDAQSSGIRVAGNIGVPEWSGHDLTIDVQGKYAQRALRIGSAAMAVNDTPVRLQAHGDVKFDGGAPTLDVAAQWTGMRWPLDGAPFFNSAAGSGTLRGPLPYDYTLNTSAVVPAELIKRANALEGEVQARGILGSDSLTMSEYTLHTLDGSLAGAASLQFAQPRAWTLSTHAAAINPAPLAPEFGGSVNFNLTAKGEGLDTHAPFDATLANLSGTLRDQPLRGGGRLQRDRKQWRAQNIELHLGDAQATLNGVIGETLNVDATLQARSLQTLVPEAQGQVRFTGSAHGPAKSPRVVAKLQADNLRYAQWQITSVTADVDLDASGGNPSKLAVVVQHAGQSEPVIESLRINGNGVAASHQITVDVLGIGDANNPAPHTSLAIDGKYASQAWSGTLRATEISDGHKIGEPLTMPQPATFVVARDQLSLEKLCLALGHGQLCADGKWQRDGPWEGTVSGYEIPLAVVLPPSGPETEYAGRIEGRVHASGAPGQPWLLDAGARIIDAAVIYTPPGADPETLNLGNGGLSATATAARLDFSLGLQAFEDTFLYANAHVERNGRNDLLHLPLTGDLRARAADANILPVVFTEIDNAAGLLTAKVDIKGTLAAPEIDGRIELTNGSFDSYRVNLALRNLNLVADLASNSVDFHGSGTAGDGHMDVSGRFTWEKLALHGVLKLKGENLLVSDLPEYRAVASPDLLFRIDDRQVSIAGDVVVPSARIKPVNLSGAVQSSDDARYVGETEAERTGRMTVRSEVHIKMGDDVRIEAFGLQGKVVGAVGTTVATGETPLGRGELSVDDGRYAAYGQKLDITRGRLLFDVSPLDDPGLDIEAQRKIETITVGMNVRGTLKSPRLSFFSDPSMPQTQIMSYLLVGKGIDNMQSGEAATAGSATDALAVQGGGLLASRLGHRIGLEEVGVQSSTTSSGKTDTALVLGKFLSPRLFISYGISLTESINTFKLRYTVSDRWLLKMEAGEVQSADAEYTIER